MVRNVATDPTLRAGSADAGEPFSDAAADRRVVHGEISILRLNSDEGWEALACAEVARPTLLGGMELLRQQFVDLSSQGSVCHVVSLCWKT